MARALIAIAALAALHAACTRDEGQPARQTVRFQLFGDGAEVAAYRKLARAFEARRPGTTVELTPVANQRDFMAKLTTSFAGGTPPDLFLINYRRFGQYAAKGILEPLGERLDRSATLKRADLFAEPLEAFAFEGQLTCVPQNVSSLVVYFNRALFTQAKVPFPKDDWTWDDLADAAWKLTRDEDGDGRAEVYGIGLEPSLTRLAPFVWQAGGDVVDDLQRPTRLILGRNGGPAALTFVWSLRQQLQVAPSLEEVKAEELERRFARGKLAMLLNSRRATPAFRAVQGLDWDVAALPHRERYASVLHSDAYCIAKTSKRKEAAFAFIEFAVGPEGGAIIAQSGRTVPSHRALAHSAAFLQPEQRPASARVFLDSVPTLRRLPNISTWHEVETRVDPELEEWFYGVPEEPKAGNVEANQRRHLQPRPAPPKDQRTATLELRELLGRLDLVTTGLFAEPAP